MNKASLCSLSLALCLGLTSCREWSAASQRPEVNKQESQAVDTRLPVKVSGKWGYANESGRLVINPQFDGANLFHEGLASVCLGTCDWFAEEIGQETHYGFIDSSGRIVISPQYQSASPFSEGLAVVCTGDCSLNRKKPHQFGYVGREGNIVIPLQFGEAHSFKESVAAVCIGECAWISGGGYTGKWGFIDRAGHFVINPIYDDVEDFENDFAKVTIGTGGQGKIGYINKTGKVIWQPSN